MSFFPSRSPFRSAHNHCAGLCCVALALAGSLAAQETAPAAPAAIPRFELPTSGLEWKAPVHPLKFFDATGHRAGVFGKQTGQYEAWIYPIKVLHGLRLEFRQEGMSEPVRGEAYLEQIIARPESTTLVYVHPRFTVRQIIWTPLDEPAIVNFFDVDSDKPLAITAKFVPDFKPMWPASLGGQYTYWMAEEKAFGITDGTSKPTAVVGSPSVGAFTEHMDHSMVGGEMLLQLRVEPEQARKTIPALVMSLSMESSKKAREIYSNVLAHARELYESRVKYHKDFLARTLTIETPDAELNRAFTWAKVAIDAGWVCHEKMGCGLVAGYGPAGDYERPGFAWWFGGDALMASWAMLDYGDIPGALQVLRFLKARQRADGKMMHEMTQSVDLVDWFGKYGFAYYHADTTPMYIYSVAEYWRRTGDKKFLEEFWPSVKKAYEWCLTTVDPTDGLMDNTKAGLAAVEVGPLRGKVTKDIYLEGFWLASLKAVREIAYQTADLQVADNALEHMKKAEASLRSKWWNPQGPYFAFGVTADGKREDMIGSWPAVLHSIYSFENGKGLDDDIEILARPELNTDWGIRWISNKDSLYDPLSYNNGSVWPFMSGFAASAFYNFSAPLNGYALWTSNARLTGLSSPGALPELLTGDRFRSMERAVPHQLFSSVGVVTPAVRGLLNLSVERKGRSFIILNGEDHSGEPELGFVPSIPAAWPYLRFSRFAIGENHLSGEVRQQPGKVLLRLEYDGKAPIKVILDPALPSAARVRRVIVNGKQVEFEQDSMAGFTYVFFDFELKSRAGVEIEYDGGIGIVPPEPRPEPGDRTTSLKIIRVEHDLEKTHREINLTLAGLGGRTYTLDLVTTEPKLTAEGTMVKKTENGYRLEISFEGPENEYVTRQIRLRW
jgi:glycogen debranching enzyme